MGPVKEISSISPEEQEKLFETQRRKARKMALYLVLFVIALVIATIVVLSQSGFIPLNDNDLFRST